MTVTLSVWLLPAVATMVVWTLAVFYRAASYSSGDYGFGAALDALLRLIFGVSLTLLIWLLFFAAMWWLA